MAERVGLLGVARLAPPGPPFGRYPRFVPRQSMVSARRNFASRMAERVGFEPTCRFYPTIRFRVGAVMTASVPLRRSRRDQGAAILAESPCGAGSFMRALTLAAALVALGVIGGCGQRAPAPALDAIRARGELRVAT